MTICLARGHFLYPVLLRAQEKVRELAVASLLAFPILPSRVEADSAESQEPGLPPCPNKA